MVVSRADASVGRRAALGLLGLVLATGSLVGCQSNPEPPPIEAASSSPSPSPSPTEAPPTLPAEANGTSEAAAKAFVRHYIELVNFAVATGDTQALEVASYPDCASCEAVIDRVEAVYSAGGSIESEGWAIRSLTPVPGQSRLRPRFDVGLVMSPQRVTERSGAKVKSFDGGRLPATFSLARQAGRWQVSDWERAA